MKILQLSFVAALAFAVQPAFAKHKFNNYPVKVYKGKNKKVKLNANTRSYRTRFRNLSKESVNFAGHYSLGFVGCGTSCVMGMLYDARSGRTSFLPSGSLTGCYLEDGFKDSEVYFKKNSRLLILAGSFEDSDGCQTRYYLEKNGRLKLIKKSAFR